MIGGGLLDRARDGLEAIPGSARLTEAATCLSIGRTRLLDVVRTGRTAGVVDHATTVGQLSRHAGCSGRAERSR